MILGFVKMYFTWLYIYPSYYLQKFTEVLRECFTNIYPLFSIDDIDSILAIYLNQGRSLLCLMLLCHLILIIFCDAIHQIIVALLSLLFFKSTFMIVYLIFIYCTGVLIGSVWHVVWYSCWAMRLVYFTISYTAFSLVPICHVIFPRGAQEVPLFKRLAYTLNAYCYGSRSVTQPDDSSKRYL